jgi:NitT/TauT family transport system substrate-binding protein
MKTLNFSRRWIIATFVGLALACLFSAYALLTHDKPISIAAHVWLGYEPMFMARNEGWLDKEQVHLIETTSATGSLKALAEGRVDGAALTLDEMLQARASGLPLTAVLIFNVSAGADILVARASIKSLSGLKGKRIAVEKSSVGEIMLAEILRIAQLTKQDVVPVWLSVDQHLDAWNHHQVDAAITYEPVASLLIAQDAVRIFDSRSMPNRIIDVLAIRTDKLDHSHASAVRHLIVAHFKALHHVTHNPQDASYRMATHLGLPANGVLNAYKGLLLPDIDNNYRLLAGKHSELGNTAQKLSQIMVNAGMLKQNDTFKSLVDVDFLPTESLR